MGQVGGGGAGGQRKKQMRREGDKRKKEEDLSRKAYRDMDKRGKIGEQLKIGDSRRLTEYEQRINIQTRQTSAYSATHTAAMPIPVPTHILVTPTFLPVLRSSVNKVLTCQAPVQPSG